MKNTIAKRNADKATAKNVNNMELEDQMNLGCHLIAKHGHNMFPTLLDRVESLAAGYGIDHVAIDGLNRLGIEL